MAKGLIGVMEKLQLFVAKRFKLDDNNVDETLMAKGLDRRAWICAAVDRREDRTSLIPNETNNV